jgi:uncharacterized protein (UPF0335 family)
MQSAQYTKQTTTIPSKETESCQEQVERLEAENRMLWWLIGELSAYGDFSTKKLCKSMLKNIKEGAD